MNAKTNSTGGPTHDNSKGLSIHCPLFVLLSAIFALAIVLQGCTPVRTQPSKPVRTQPSKVGSNAPETAGIHIGATEIRIRKPGETKTQVIDTTPIPKSMDGTIQEIAPYEPPALAAYIVVAGDDGDLKSIVCGSKTEVVTASGTQRFADVLSNLQVGQRVKVDYEIETLVKADFSGEVIKRLTAKKIIIINN